MAETQDSVDRHSQATSGDRQPFYELCVPLFNEGPFEPFPAKVQEPEDGGGLEGPHCQSAPNPEHTHAK